MTTKCFPEEAIFGGAIIGAATGVWMMASGKVAGNSGALRCCVVPDPATGKVDVEKVLFVVGLLVAGVITRQITPYAFEEFANSQNGRDLLKPLKIEGFEYASNKDWDDIRALNISLLEK